MAVGTTDHRRDEESEGCREFYLEQSTRAGNSTPPPLAPGAPDRPEAHTPHGILARLDRINVWSMPFMFIGIIGTGFLFAFYDVFDINVSFIQSCIALKHGCTPANAFSTLRIPVVLNLAGYVVGALALAPLSDRIGRLHLDAHLAQVTRLRRPG